MGIQRAGVSQRSLKMSPARASNRSGHRRSRAPPNSITPMRSTALGLRFKIAEPDNGKKPRKATLGAITKIDGGRIVVSQVRRGTPSHEAGLNVDDEILAIDDFRVRPDQLDARMEQYLAGDRVSVLIARRDRLIRLDVTTGSRALEVMAARGRPIGHSGHDGPVLDLWLAQSGNPVRTG